MKYTVYVQDKEVDVVEADNTGHALAIVAKKITDGIYEINHSIPSSIKIKPHP